MSPDDPRHGKHAGYLVHIRSKTEVCLPCRVAHRRYTKAAKLRLEHGVRNRVPLGQRAWDVLTNVGCTKVAEVTGLWRNNLYRIQRRGPDQVVLRATRDAILRVQAPTAVGAQRRVQGLAMLGHTLEVIGAHAGVHPRWLARMSRADVAPRMMSPRVAEGIAAAYDELVVTPPPDDRYAAGRRTRAAAHGWLPHDVWDDIDDPHEDPLAESDPDYLDPVLLDRIVAGDVDLLELVPAGDVARTEVCRRWWESGRPLLSLERLTGWNISRYFKVRDQVSA